MEVQTLIDKAGGVVDLATKLGVARTTVLDWRRLKAIPGNRVAQISETLDLSLEDVIKLASPPRGRSAAQPQAGEGV